MRGFGVKERALTSSRLIGSLAGRRIGVGVEVAVVVVVLVDLRRFLWR